MPVPKITKDIFFQAAADFEACKTAEDVRKVWKEYYQTLGHKRLAKLFVFEYEVESIWLDEQHRAARSQGKADDE